MGFGCTYSRISRIIRYNNSERGEHFGEFLCDAQFTTDAWADPEILLSGYYYFQ